ncbi:MAG: GyrI-like domain-containing protein [Bryobacteraceae bacterium]|jgi:AraC family transcriptional regulator
MNVQIVHFPETKVAVLEHRGPPDLEYETVRKLIEWRRANGLHPERHRSYGIHYNDPRKTPPEEYRVDFCVSVDHDVPSNPEGVLNKTIPAGRCALVRHFGSRENVSAAEYLYEVWFPASGEMLRDFPIFFHYVNVGPNVQENEMITDVYLPLR